MARTSSDAAPLALAELLAEEMGRLWRHGQPHRAEDFLHRHPALADSPDAILELLAEEIGLRQEDGDEPDPAELEQRFPLWAEQVRALLACSRLLHAQAVVFPEAGTTLGDFQLLAEVGRGCHGARLPRPAGGPGRPAGGAQDRAVARARNISVWHGCSTVTSFRSTRHTSFPSTDCAACACPISGATLADLLRTMADTPPARRTGADLVAALEQLQRTAPAAVPVGGPACRFLARVSYVRAVCWLGACLADRAPVCAGAWACPP